VIQPKAENLVYGEKGRKRPRILQFYGVCVKPFARQPLVATCEPPSFKTQTDLAEALQGVLGRPVDLTSRTAVEKSRNYIRRRGILAEARLVRG